MNDSIKWSDTLKKFGIKDSYFDWTTDYKGQKLDFKKGWYVKMEDKFFKFSNPIMGANGVVEFTVQRVAENGELINSPYGKINFGYIGNEFIPIERRGE
jgi:hypothetical protein